MENYGLYQYKCENVSGSMLQNRVKDKINKDHL